MVGFLHGPVVARVQFLERINLILGKFDGFGHHRPEHIFGAGWGGLRAVVAEKGSLSYRR